MRLTVKIDNETYIPRALCGIGRDGEVDDYDGCAEYCEDGCEGECSQCGIQHCFNRLATYEDLQDKLDKQFGGCIELGEVIDTLIEYDKQLSRDEKLAKAMLITNDSVRKFREWESLEEQGKLMKLPCMVGDDVWYISERVEKQGRKKAEVSFVDHGVVDNITLGHMMIPQITVCNDENVWTTFDGMEDFGKTVFLAKEEADTALKEIKNEQ